MRQVSHLQTWTSIFVIKLTSVSRGKRRSCYDLEEQKGFSTNAECFCLCVWVGAGGQAQGHDGGLPSLQGDGAADLPGTEEHPPGAQSRWDILFLNPYFPPSRDFSLNEENLTVCVPGVDTDELDSNVDDYEEETIEFFINEEIIPLGDL